MKNTTVKFCSGVGTVTGANFLLDTGKGTKVLVDCGLVQGEKVAEDINREAFPYDIREIVALFVTHAHLDHVGRIPKLVKDGYKGPIYSTPQTKELAELVLNDAVTILANEAKQDGVEPLYDQADVDAVFPLWKTIDYHERFTLTDNISVYLKDAGHILGSSMIEFTLKRETGDQKILFTGDLGNSPAPLLRDTEEVGDVDYLIMESVYGDRNHDDREGRMNKFKQIIDETMARGGTLVIPAFSIDRTQVLLYELNNMVEQGMIQSVPVFVDSQIARGDDIFKFPRLEYTMSKNDSRDIERMNGAKIILAGSGMSVGGRVIGHEAHYLPDEKSTILLVGYQTVGSLGRKLADGAKKVRIHGEEVKVRAHIETLYGYSAHKDSDHLVEFVSTAGDEAGKTRLKEVFVVMGEPGASMHLAQRINDELGVKAIVPERGEDYTCE